MCITLVTVDDDYDEYDADNEESTKRSSGNYY